MAWMVVKSCWNSVQNFWLQCVSWKYKFIVFFFFKSKGQQLIRLLMIGLMHILFQHHTLHQSIQFPSSFRVASTHTPAVPSKYNSENHFLGSVVLIMFLFYSHSIISYLPWCSSSHIWKSLFCFCPSPVWPHLEWYPTVLHRVIHFNISYVIISE